MSQLRITEIFYSLQGESTFVGLPTVFVRLTGCPLRCGYCDTEYAFKGGEKRSIEDIVAKVSEYPAKVVCVTGGEPLAQPGCLPLLSALCDAGYTVTLETSGALDVSGVDPRVVKVMDLKTPGSGEESKNRYANLEHIQATDQIKFVICDRADYDWAVAALDTHALQDRCEVLFSPSYETLPYATLAEWILADGLNVRMQVQLHKIIWGEMRGK